MHVSVSSITYGGEKISNKSVIENLQQAILGSQRFEVDDSNLNSAYSETPKSCTIEYQNGNGVLKRRTLQRGQTFDFANDIVWIKAPEPTVDLDLFEHVFKYMDTAPGGFHVRRKDFKFPSGGRSGFRVTLRYYFKGVPRQLLQYAVREDSYFDFAQGRHVTEGDEEQKPGPSPDPPIPTSCQCPCPVCKLNHQTDQQRKAEKDKKEQEEKERRQELDRLRKAIEEAKDLADKANTRSQDTQQQVDNLKEALNDVRKLAEQASREAETAGKRAQEAKQDSSQTREELEKTRRELEVLKAQLADLLERPDVRLPETPAVIKVCFFGSQLLAVVILVTFAVKQVRGE